MRQHPQLGEICQVIAGQSPPSSTYNDDGVGLPFFQGKADFGEFHPSVRKWCSAPRKTAQRNDILISVRAPVGPTNIAEADCCIGRGLSAIRCGPDANVKYILHYLRSQEERIASLGTGSTFSAINQGQLRGIRVPLPPLPEQKRIAAILDKADSIRRKRAETIRLADEFLKSTFIDMFGDPVENPKGWAERHLGDVADIKSGVTKGRRFGTKRTVMVPYMRVANVQDGHLLLDDVTNIEVLPSDVDKYRLEKGDVLLTEGGDPDKLGRGAVWPGTIKDCIHQNHIFRVRVDSTHLNPEYTSAIIGSSRGKRYFLRSGKQTTGIASINMRQLRAFPVLLPPVGLQKEYARLVAKHTVVIERALAIENTQGQLFDALSQQAFQGEL